MSAYTYTYLFFFYIYEIFNFYHFVVSRVFVVDGKYFIGLTVGITKVSENVIFIQDKKSVYLELHTVCVCLT